MLDAESVARLVAETDAHAATSLLCGRLEGVRRFRAGVQPMRHSAPQIVTLPGPAAPDPAWPIAAGPGGEPVRADVAVAVFLTDPADYDGGDLLVDAGDGPVPYKERIGTCVVCPGASQLQLAPVTRGRARLAFIAVQSLVRDDARREILYDLASAADYFEFTGAVTDAGPSPAGALRGVRDRLLGLWVDC